MPVIVAPAASAERAPTSVAGRAGVGVQIQRTTSPFSPNADGHRDRVAVRYRLAGAARVMVDVKRGTKTVLSSRARSVRPGVHTFTWDGATATGRRAADGRYRVVVQARAGGRTRTDVARVVVDTVPDRLDAGTLALSSDRLYPRTRVIEDVVVGNFDLTDLAGVGDWQVRHLPGRAIETTRAQVLDHAGRVVAVEPVSSVAPRSSGIDDRVYCDRCGRFTWDGRDSDGVLLPAGAYRIRIVQGRDAAGNARVLSDAETVMISDERLVATTSTLTYAAAEAPQTGEPWIGCNDCSVYVCAPVPSARFPGGLRFTTAGRAPCTSSVAYFTAPVPGRRTPYDRFVVAATGGPSTPGDTSATANLVTGVSPDGATKALVGEVSTAAAWAVQMAPNSEVHPDGWPAPVVWRVQGSEYDIASFKVTITTYVEG